MTESQHLATLFGRDRDLIAAIGLLEVLESHLFHVTPPLPPALYARANAAIWTIIGELDALLHDEDPTR